MPSVFACAVLCCWLLYRLLLLRPAVCSSCAAFFFSCVSYHRWCRHSLLVGSKFCAFDNVASSVRLFCLLLSAVAPKRRSVLFVRVASSSFVAVASSACSPLTRARAHTHLAPNGLHARHVSARHPPRSRRCCACRVLRARVPAPSPHRIVAEHRLPSRRLMARGVRRRCGVPCRAVRSRLARPPFFVLCCLSVAFSVLPCRVAQLAVCDARTRAVRRVMVTKLNKSKSISGARGAVSSVTLSVLYSSLRHAPPR